MAGTGPTYPLPRPACERLCQGSPGTTTGLTLQLPELWAHEPLTEQRQDLEWRRHTNNALKATGEQHQEGKWLEHEPDVDFVR